MNYKLISQCLDLAEDSVIITEANPLSFPGPKIVYVNKAFTRMTGFEYEDVIGKTPRILQGEKTSEVELNKIRIALRNNDYIRIELINYHKNGIPFWMELSMSPIFNELGEIEYFISVQKNINKRKEEEAILKNTVAELQSKVEMLNQINLATIHDLKEPIRSIHSFSQLLERHLNDKLDETSNEFLSFIKSGSKRLESTIDTLNQYSFTNSTIEVEEISLFEVISEASQNLHQKFIDKKAILEVEGNGVISGNRSEIIRFFQNLIDNCLTHSTLDLPPKIKIHIKEEQGEIKILVEDNGVGIPDSFQSKIFNLFSRFNTNTTEKGQGVGLAFCKKIVQSNNGSIEILKSSEKGTTFIIKFRQGSLGN